MDKVDKYLNEGKDEDTAAKAWKLYHTNIKKYDLDNNPDRNHQGTVDYMYDAFFAGYYACRTWMKKTK